MPAKPNVKLLVRCVGLVTLVWASASLSGEETGPASRPKVAATHFTRVSQGTPQASQDPHDEVPSLQCFDCHGPHPLNNAADFGSAQLEIPPHARGPELTCANCHPYEATIEALDPNGCVGCHARGGYPITAALETLTREVGHPSVVSFMREVPADCLLCHRDNLGLGPRLHRRHLFQGQQFVRHFQTGCVRCHALAESGEITVTSQPLR